MKIRLKADCAMGKGWYGILSKNNRAFLESFPTAVVRACVRHNMNYYRMPNGFLVHIYNAYEI